VGADKGVTYSLKIFSERTLSLPITETVSIDFIHSTVATGDRLSEYSILPEK